MIEELRSRTAHFLGLLHVGLLSIWFWGLYGLAGLFILWRDEFWRPADPEKYRLIALLPHLGSPLWIAVTGVAIAMWLFEASFRKQRVMLDRADMQRLLKGLFIGRTFMYAGELTLGKIYENGFQVERLKAGFDTVTAHAPRNSVATIKLQFMNARGDHDKYRFEVRDGRGRIFDFGDIYQSLEIRLDQQSQFGLRLVCDETYEIVESASLWVKVEAWRR